MEYSKITQNLINRAKQNLRKIVLTETTDLRILEAASIISKEKIANIVLIGDKEQISKTCLENNIDINLDLIEVVDNTNFPKIGEYVDKLYELRKNKGITKEDAIKLLQDKIYFGVMMVKLGDADGLVSGAIHSTADILRPALQIIKTKPEINSVSSFFIMESNNKKIGEDGVFVFSDCGLIEIPTEEQLFQIATMSAKSFKLLVEKSPKVAMLSYSTHGSAKSESIDKVVRVTEKLKKSNLDFDVDGELQLDAAILPEVASIKAKNSSVAGKANVLVFPNIEAGNIGYKLAQHFGQATAIGPITQGLLKPINDLSRACNVLEIIGAVAITSIQSLD